MKNPDFKSRRQAREERQQRIKRKNKRTKGQKELCLELGAEMGSAGMGHGGFIVLMNLC